MFDHWKQRFSFKEEDIQGFPSLKLSYRKSDRADGNFMAISVHAMVC